MLPSAEFSTRSCSVSAMTWLFVSARPFDEMMMPVPAAAPPDGEARGDVHDGVVELRGDAAGRRCRPTPTSCRTGSVKSVGRCTTASSRWPIVYPTTPAIASANAAVSRIADATPRRARRVRRRGRRAVVAAAVGRVRDRASSSLAPRPGEGVHHLARSWLRTTCSEPDSIPRSFSGRFSRAAGDDAIARRW